MVRRIAAISHILSIACALLIYCLPLARALDGQLPTGEAHAIKKAFSLR